MERNNLNQQNAAYRRRKCIAYKPNDFFEAYDKSQNEIVSNYKKSAQNMMVKSLTILIENIRKTTKIEIKEPSSPKNSKAIKEQSLMSLIKNAPTFKKQPPQPCVQEDESTNPQKEVEEIVHFEKTGKKLEKSAKKIEYCLEQKQEKPNYANTKKHQKLINSLKRLSVADELEELEKQLENIPQNGARAKTEDTNLLNFDEQTLKHKSISELISQSNAKTNNLERKKQSPIESEESEYQITDHESNESSNESDDYSQRFAFDSESSSLFGGFFSKMGNSKDFGKFSTDSIPHPPAKLNFKPLLDSPKKSKTKRKRLFINKKKVPRWAENLDKVRQVYESEQQRNLRKNFKDIFGICIVENMQTNTIFNRNDSYTRSSTVRWEKGKFIV